MLDFGHFFPSASNDSIIGINKFQTCPFRCACCVWCDGNIRLTCSNMFLPNAFKADGLLITKATNPEPGRMQAEASTSKAN